MSGFKLKPIIFALPAIIACVANVCAQDSFGVAQNYPVIDQSPPMLARGDPQPLPSVQAVQPTAAENAPPDYGALPPPDNGAYADLSKRVDDLEKELAKYAKPGGAPGYQQPTKPLIAPSGRIQFDASTFSQNAASNAQFGNVQNAVGFRRARIALLGEYEVFDYIVEMDFANRGINSVVNAKDQSTAFKDVYIQMRELPVLGNVRVGHFKECFGLEQMTSDNYTTFMERSVDDEGAFVPGRNDGIMAYNWTENQRATWAVGGFTNQTGYDQPPTFVYDHWGMDLAARLTYLPWYDECSGGRGLLHTGVDYAYRSAPDHIGTFATRSEDAFGPSVVNMAATSTANNTLTDVKDWQVVDGEAALVYGPFSMQSEVFGATVERFSGNNDFFGAYAYVSYFLTGENRPYNRKLGVFDRVRPYENFFRVRTCDGDVQTGWGAWEVAYRFSYIDMLDGLTNTGAGLATDHTFGVNWYMNPFTRVMFNYVHSTDTYNKSSTQRITGGEIDQFLVRFAMDF